MRVSRVAERDLATLQEDWNRLAAENPFRSYEWQAACWQHYHAVTHQQPRAELYTLVVKEGEVTVGIAPWYQTRSARTGKLLRFLGDGEACSDFLGVLCMPGKEAAVGEAIAEWLARAARQNGSSSDRWETLQLSGTDPNDTVLSIIAGRLHGGNPIQCQRFKEHTWRIALPADWNGYLNLLSKSHRKQLRQRERRLFDSGQAILCTAQDVSEVEAGWNILVDLHQRRWSKIGMPGCFASEVYRDFHHAATKALFATGRLRLHWMLLHDRPVAAEYHLAGGGIVYAYQGGIDPDAIDDEPGCLATMATLHLAIQQGYRAFDFCRGDEPYKPHWRAEPTPSVQWRIVANRPSAKLRHCVWTVQDQARRAIKSRLGIGNTDWRVVRGS